MPPGARPRKNLSTKNINIGSDGLSTITPDNGRCDAVLMNHRARSPRKGHRGAGHDPIKDRLVKASFSLHVTLKSGTRRDTPAGPMLNSLHRSVNVP